MFETLIMSASFFSWERLKKALFKALPLVALTGLVLFALAYLYLRYTPPLFLSEAWLLYEPKEPSILSEQEFVPRQVKRDVQRLSFIIHSEQLGEYFLKYFPWEYSLWRKGVFLNTEVFPPQRVIKVEILSKPTQSKSVTLYLDVSQDSIVIYLDPDMRSPVRVVRWETPFSIDGHTIVLKKGTTFSDSDLEYDYVITINSRQSAIANFLSTVQSSLIDPANGLFSISATTNNRTKAHQFVQATVEALKDFDRDKQMEETQKTLSFARSQLNRLYKDIVQLQRRIAELQAKSLLTQTSTGLSQDDLKELQEWTEELWNLKFQLRIIGEMEKQLQEDSVISTSLIPFLPDAMTSMQRDFDRLVSLKTELLRLKTMYSPSHPDYILKKQQLAELVSELQESINLMKEMLSERIKELENKINSVAKGRTMTASPVAELYRLERELNTKEKLYSFLTQTIFELEMKLAGYVSPFVVIKSPVIPQSPISPNKMRTYILAGGTWFLLATLIIVLSYLSQSTITTLDEITKQTKLPIIGTIPYVKSYQGFNPEKIPPELLESFRSVHLTATMLIGKSRNVALCITSNVPKEGKTFIASHLALASSIGRKKVLLIDADLRKADLSRTFSEDIKPGFIELLEGSATLEQVIRPQQFTIGDSQANFDFIPTGRPILYTAELLGSPNTEEVMRNLTSQYDIVIIDTAPVGTVVDAMPLIQLSDGVLFTVRISYSHYQSIKTAEWLKEELGIPFVALVANGVVASSKRYGYGSYYYGKKGYYIYHRYYTHMHKRKG
ncbi:MAG: AAA family ATPase [Chlorobi bacterium]|nr:AAA family ATPase [Chlorobiota bacterium]